MTLKQRIQSRADRTPDPRVSEKLRKLAEEAHTIEVKHDPA